MSNKFADLGFEPVETVDSFEPAFRRTLAFEGGNTVDHAGPTNLGVTQDTYNNWRKRQGLPTKSVRDIDEGEAKEFYRKEYFEKPGFSKLPANVAGVLFDFGVNAGTPRAAMALQKAVGASPDGVIGPKTLKAVDDFVNRKGEQPLLQSIIDQRSSHVDSLIQKNPAKYKKFEKGWKNRINAIKAEFDLSSLNPFAVSEAGADEIPQGDFADLGFEEAATPSATLPEATETFDDLGFEPQVKESLGETVNSIAGGLWRGMGEIPIGVSGVGKAILELTGDKASAEHLQRWRDNQRANLNFIFPTSKDTTDFGKHSIKTGLRAVSESTPMMMMAFGASAVKAIPEFQKIATAANLTKVQKAVKTAEAMKVISAREGLKGAALFAPQAFSDTYDAARAHDVSPQLSATLGLTNAVGQVVLESKAFDFMLRGTGTGNLAYDIFMGAFVEGVMEEGTQGVLQNALTFVYDKPKEFQEGFSRLMQGVPEGIFAGALMGSVAGGAMSKTRTQIQKERDAMATKEVALKIMENNAKQIGDPKLAKLGKIVVEKMSDAALTVDLSDDTADGKVLDTKEVLDQAPAPSKEILAEAQKPATPVERAAKYGEVVGIDAETGLKIIDRSVKPEKATIQTIQAALREAQNKNDTAKVEHYTKRLAEFGVNPSTRGLDKALSEAEQQTLGGFTGTQEEWDALVSKSKNIPADVRTPTPTKGTVPIQDVSAPAGENVIEGGDLRGQSIKGQEVSTKENEKNVLIPTGPETVTPTAPVSSNLENQDAIKFYNDSVKTNKVTETNAPEKSFNVGRILDNVKNSTGIKGNNVFISAKKIAHIFKQRQKHSDFIISHIDKILNTDEVYRNVSNEGVLRDDKSYLFVKRLHRNFVAVVEVNVSKDGNEIRTIMTKDSREIKKLEPFKIPVVKAGEAPETPIQGLEPLAARRLSTLQPDNNIPEQNKNVNINKSTTQATSPDLGSVQKIVRVDEAPPLLDNKNIPQNKNIVKGKGDPASLKPPTDKKLPPHLQKIVDQQKGIDDVTPEGYGPSKGIESSSGGKSIDDYEPRTPQQKDAEFKLFKAVQDLAKKWVKSSIGEKYAPKKSSGVRFKDTGTILVRSMNNLAVMVHEVTHDIAKRTSLIDDVLKVKGYAKNGNPIYAKETKPARKEFTDIYVKYYGGGKADHKLSLRVNEGLSMLIQRMAEAPSLTKKEFPYLTKEVLTPGGKYYDPQYTELIADAEKIVEIYQSLSPLNKIGARVITSGRDIDKQSFLSVPERIIEESVDRIYPIEKMAKKAGVSGTIEDPSLWARAYNVIRYIALENINTNKGYVTIKDGEFKKIYDFNWKSLLDNLHKEGGDKNIEDFSYWLVARQTHYLYERLDGLKDKVKEAAAELQDIGKENVTKEDIKAAQDVIAEYKELNEIIKNDNIKRELADAAFKSEEKRFKTHAEMFDKLVRADLDLLHSPEVQLVNDKRYEKLTAEQGYAPRQRDVFNEVIGSPSENRPVARSLTGKSKISSMLGRTGSDLPIISPVYGAMMNHLEILKKANRQIVYNIIGEKVASFYPELFQKLPLERVVSDDGRISYPQEKDPNIMMTYSGQKRTPFLVDKEVKSLIDELFAFEDMHILEKALRKATNMFVKGTTALYPPFAISNFIIDQFTAVAQTRNNLVPVMSQLKTLYKILSTHGSKEAQYFKEYLALGGERQTLVEISELSPEDSYRELLKERDMLHKIGGLLSDGLNLLAIPSKWSEIFTRGTEYVLARKAGKPQLVALEEAGRVTAPFHHEGRAGGHVGRSAVKAYPYLKAGMQVLAQSARSMADNPTARKRYLFAFAALTASGIGAMAYFINNASDDQKDLYKALRPGELSGYIFLPHPNKEDLIRIRVPDQMNVVATFVNMLIADKMIDAKYKPYDYVSGATSFLPDQLNVTDPQRQFLSLVPQLAAPLVGVSTNKRLYPDVRPLESQSMLARPAKYRYYENTSQAALWLGDKLDLSPVKIDFLIEGYAGRAMKFATGKEIPNVMVRKMYIESSRQVQDYYDLSEKVDQERKALRDGLRKEKYNTESEELDLLNDKINEVKKNLDKFRDIKKIDRNDPELKKLRRDILDSIDSLPKDIEKDNPYFKEIRKDIEDSELKIQRFLQSPARR